MSLIHEDAIQHELGCHMLDALSRMESRLHHIKESYMRAGRGFSMKEGLVAEWKAKNDELHHQFLLEIQQDLDEWEAVVRNHLNSVN